MNDTGHHHHHNLQHHLQTASHVFLNQHPNQSVEHLPPGVAGEPFSHDLLRQAAKVGVDDDRCTSAAAARAALMCRILPQPGVTNGSGGGGGGYCCLRRNGEVLTTLQTTTASVDGGSTSTTTPSPRVTSSCAPPLSSSSSTSPSDYFGDFVPVMNGIGSVTHQQQQHDVVGGQLMTSSFFSPLGQHQHISSSGRVENGLAYPGSHQSAFRFPVCFKFKLRQ